MLSWEWVGKWVVMVVGRVGRLVGGNDAVDGVAVYVRVALLLCGRLCADGRILLDGVVMGLRSRNDCTAEEDRVHPAPRAS